MEKSPEAFRTISEVAEVLETPAHVLRFWESRFPQIRPVKRAGGRRYYRPSDVALLAGIKRLLHEDGLTIRGVQKILQEQGVRHVAGLTDEEAEAGLPAPDPVAAEPIPLFPAQMLPDQTSPDLTPDLPRNPPDDTEPDAAGLPGPQAIAAELDGSLAYPDSDIVAASAESGEAAPASADTAPLAPATPGEPVLTATAEQKADAAPPEPEADAQASPLPGGALPQTGATVPVQSDDPLAETPGPDGLTQADSPTEDIGADAGSMDESQPAAPGGPADAATAPPPEPESAQSAATTEAAPASDPLAPDPLAPDAPVPERPPRWLAADLRALRATALQGKADEAEALARRLRALRDRLAAAGHPPVR